MRLAGHRIPGPGSATAWSPDRSAPAIPRCLPPAVPARRHHRLSRHHFLTRSCGWYGSHPQRTSSRRSPMAVLRDPGAADPSADPSRRFGRTGSRSYGKLGLRLPFRCGQQPSSPPIFQAITGAAKVEHGRMVRDRPESPIAMIRSPKVVPRSPLFLFEVRMMLPCSKTCDTLRCACTRTRPTPTNLGGGTE